MKLLIVKATVAAAALVAVPALAHKAKSGHTHCTVDGKGVEVGGKTDAERKAACGTLHGTWNEKADAKVETKAADVKTKAPATESAPSTEAPAMEAPATEAPATDTAP